VKHLPELMAILAHDMRNPLSALLTNIHFVQSIARGSALDIDEALTDSALSCSVLGQIIGNLEVLGRAFAGARPPATAVGTREAAAQAVARVAQQALLAAIEPVMAPGPGATVLVEPLLFGRALDNLLANALQYAPAKTKITVELATAGERACVRVIDVGPIVPPEFRERVLTEEGQGAAKKRYEARYGRGLGLYCAGQAAHLAGADLTLGEREGHAVAELWGPLVP
jgi:signal transduction histidine kinase